MRSAVRDLVVSLEAESRGCPRPVKVRQLAVEHTHTPALVASPKWIQEARETLRARTLPPEREAQLWDERTKQAVYHTNRMEGNPLTFEEARAVIEAHKKGHNGLTLISRARDEQEMRHT